MHIYIHTYAYIYIHIHCIYCVINYLYLPWCPEETVPKTERLAFPAVPGAELSPLIEPFYRNKNIALCWSGILMMLYVLFPIKPDRMI